MAFKVRELDIPGLKLITPQAFPDERGYFTEVFKQPEFLRLGIGFSCLQVNHSESAKGVLRGLHYQLSPFAQAKLLRVISGKIFDVAVDIRKGSPYYGKWAGIDLSSAERQLLFIPEGFAHGFCALQDATEVEYFASNVYSPDHERGVIYNDPELDIKWPFSSPLLSEKDSLYPVLDKAENNFVYEK